MKRRILTMAPWLVLSVALLYLGGVGYATSAEVTVCLYGAGLLMGFTVSKRFL